jgi:hypothetical protein
MLSASHPVVFFMNGLGDYVLNLPALRALTTMFRGRCSLICGNAPAVALFDELSIDKRLRVPGRQRFSPDAVVSELGTCDLFVSLAPWFSESLSILISSLKPQLSIGMFDEYDVPIPRNYDKHTTDLAFDVATRIDPTYRIEQFLGPPRLPAFDRQRTADTRALLPSGARVLAVHADTAAEKMWRAADLVTTLDLFLCAHPEYYVFLVGTSDQHLDVGHFSDRVIPCYGLPFTRSCAIVMEADLFLGVDSCMLHVADFARVPGVGLFGPTEAHEFGFRIGPNVTVQARGTMTEIRVEHVLRALTSLIEQRDISMVWNI